MVLSRPEFGMFYSAIVGGWYHNQTQHLIGHGQYVHDLYSRDKVILMWMGIEIKQDKWSKHELGSS